VFLDIAWIKEKLPNSEEHIKRKLPGMYHQFKELADIDITREPMEIGPTTHYIMGGIRVDAESQMSTVPGLFAAGECAAGLHGANRLGGNSLSDLLVFGRRAGRYAADYAKSNSEGQIDSSQVDSSAAWALAVFNEEGERTENPFQIHKDLQAMMQDLVGIVRHEDEMRKALEGLTKLNDRYEHVLVGGNRDYNPGWHTAMDLANMLTVSEAVTRSALVRKESRGGHFRLDYPGKDEGLGKVNTVIRKAPDGLMKVSQEPVPELTAEHKAIIEENK
jgi:succinate dehydrogenase / fumarate reductase flavoprotein subunit